MTPQDDEFLARLLLTFREEARDHLDMLVAGVMDLEKIDEKSQVSRVEPVFRATHSLKGAARAVGLRDIETVCQNLESVFSAVKNGKIILHSPEFNLIHLVITNLEGLLAGDKKVKTSLLVRELKKITSSGPGETEGKPDATRQEKEAGIPSTGEKPGKPETVDIGGVPLNLSTSSLPEQVRGSTIRISEERLRSLYATADDLLSLRLTSGSRIADIREISLMLQHIRWKFNHVEGDIAALGTEIHSTNQALVRVLSFIDEARDAINTSEIRLSGAIRVMKQDQMEMDSVVTGFIENIREVVLVPVSSLTDSFPRIIRDIAREVGKNVDVVIKGSDIEIDRRVIDAIRDPLVHLLRNAVDHGIESPEKRKERGKDPVGKITVNVSHSRAHQVTITISDDGQGIDPDTVAGVAVSKDLVSAEDLGTFSRNEKLLLIFRSGLSTAETVSTVSGRGLGLVIVQEKITTIGGSISLSSMKDAGTTFTLTVPVSLATFRGILVYVEDRPFFLPLQMIDRVYTPGPSDIGTIEGHMVLYLDGQVIPAGYMSQVLGLAKPGESLIESGKTVVITDTFGDKIGFFVDRVSGAEEIVVRDLGPQLREVRFISGVAIIHNTLIVPVLNVEDMAEALQKHIPDPARPQTSCMSAGRRRILVVEDSITSRMLLKNILEAAGYKVETAVDGLDAFTRLKTGSVDLVVSDVDMPRMNGFLLTEKIRSEKRFSDLPVILVTSLDAPEDRERGIASGANAYLVKSGFDQGNLLDMIKKLMVGSP